MDSIARNLARGGDHADGARRGSGAPQRRVGVRLHSGGSLIGAWGLDVRVGLAKSTRIGEIGPRGPGAVGDRAHRSEGPAEIRGLFFLGTSAVSQAGPELPVVAAVCAPSDGRYPVWPLAPLSLDTAAISRPSTVDARVSQVQPAAEPAFAVLRRLFDGSWPHDSCPAQAGVEGSVGNHRGSSRRRNASVPAPNRTPSPRHGNRPAP